MAERTTVRLHQDLLERAKRKAAAEGRTLTALIEDGLRMVIAGDNKGTKRKRVMPRVSVAHGGTLPGIDLDDLAPIQEADDRDYLRRSKRRP
jgi:hypothetical protein